MLTWQEAYRNRLKKKNPKRTIKSGLSISNNSYQIALMNSDVIDIYNYSKYTDDNGITRDGWICSVTDFVADVNDMTEEKKEKEWGYDLKVDKTVYCVPNEKIIESSLIKYNGKYYSISKIKRCKNTSLQASDAYYKIAIKLFDKEVKIVEGCDS